MKRTWFLRGLLLIVCLTVLATGFALATGLNFSLDWWTVDGGGGTFSTGGDFTLGGTIGQPDSGVMTGGDYTLGGGFWGGGELQTAQSFVFLPVAIK